MRELQEDYSDIVSGEMALMNAVSEIYHETGIRFVIIFDEWDYPIRELDETNPDRIAAWIFQEQCRQVVYTTCLSYRNHADCADEGTVRRQ